MFAAVSPAPLQRQATLHRAGTFQRRSQNEITSHTARGYYQQQQIYALLNDINLPDTLVSKQPIYYYVYVLLILAVYTAADVFTGLTLGVPSFSGASVDHVILIGWGAHFIGLLSMCIYLFIMLFKRYSYSSSLLLLMYLASVCCIGSSILFTSRLSSSDIIHNLGGQTSIAIYLQWIGSILLYCMMTFLTYHSTRQHSIHDITQDDITRHTILIQMKNLLTDNQIIGSDIASYRNQLLQSVNDEHHHTASNDNVSADNVSTHSYDTQVETIKHNELDQSSQFNNQNVTG